jgi:hypothetical protein
MLREGVPVDADDGSAQGEGGVPVAILTPYRVPGVLPFCRPSEGVVHRRDDNKQVRKSCRGPVRNQAAA